MASDTTIQLDLDLLLPDIESADECVDALGERLMSQKGIQRVHIVQDDGHARLCIHFDPNQITLPAVERLARDTSASIHSIYRHEWIAISGLNSADAGPSLERLLREERGILHVSVNNAAGLIFVAYDAIVTDREALEEAIRRFGARIERRGTAATVIARPRADTGPAAHGHDHGSAPKILPHWLQERWTILLIMAAGVFFLIGWLGGRVFGMTESVSTIFFLLTYAAAGYDVATHAIPALFKGILDTDILMLAAALGAAILGQFGEGAFLLLLFAIGHAGEHYALDRARNAIGALGALMPKTALLRRREQVVETLVEELATGDVVLARPGDRIAVDGVIVAGASVVDQSPITGESVPVSKVEGDQVFAGTVNKDNALDVRVTRLAADNTLNRVMQLVSEAQSQQSPTQKFASRFTRRFVPIVFIVTALVVIIPPLLGLMPLSESFYRGLLLLVAASPCALAIGTPAAALAGIAQAARNGVLVKGGAHLENLGGLRAIAFDKTGTITSGQFSVTDVIPLNGAEANELLCVAAAVELHSNHPLAQAVAQEARNRSLRLPEAVGLENVPGRGVVSAVAGEPVRIGSLRMFEDIVELRPDDALVKQVAALEQAGRSTMIVSQGERFLGVLGLADTARPGVAGVMSNLKALGMDHLVMLTGDNEAVALNIAGQVGLTDVQAGLLPEDKLTTINNMKVRFGAIAMVGDGVNDAPALASATVGIAMGGAGTAVALETADVALMADDLGMLPFAVGLSRASRRIIKQNLAIAMGVIALLIVTSVLGLVQMGLVVLLHEGSTLVVVGNALRLLGYRRGLPG
ncbi:MAG: heavy metal translocating P-type ATPase [Anaerolineae bacterium]|nr:heavy metal translocating P-type ATPase [Anaerolineae bacterium]